MGTKHFISLGGLFVGLSLFASLWAIDSKAAVSVDEGSWGKAPLKGINCGSWQTEPDLSKMKSWGVGVLRLQLLGDVFAPVSTEKGWSLSEKAFGVMDGFLARAKKQNLRVIVDYHNHGHLFPNDSWSKTALAAWKDEEKVAKAVELWRSLAERYREERGTIAGFDLLNEPHPPDNLDGYQAWNEVAKKITRGIREVNTYHTLVVESAGYGEAPHFAHLEPTGDPNTVYSFHFYRPHEFAEQGTRTNWPFGMDGKSGFVYPGEIPLGWDTKTITLVDRAYLEKGIQAVRDFQKKYSARIWVGEFSAVRWAPYAKGDSNHNSTYYYLKDCLEMFTREGWDWTYHSYLDSASAMWSPEHSTDRADRKAYPSTDRLDLLKSYWK